MYPDDEGQYEAEMAAQAEYEADMAARGRAEAEYEAAQDKDNAIN